MASVIRRVRKAVRARQGFKVRAAKRRHGVPQRSAGIGTPPGAGALAQHFAGKVKWVARSYADGFSPIVSGEVTGPEPTHTGDAGRATGDT